MYGASPGTPRRCAPARWLSAGFRTPFERLSGHRSIGGGSRGREFRHHGGGGRGDRLADVVGYCGADAWLSVQNCLVAGFRATSVRSGLTTVTTRSPNLRPSAGKNSVCRSVIRGPAASPCRATSCSDAIKGEPGTGIDLACAGWLAQFGGDNGGVRLAIMQGRLPDSALKPGVNWPPLHGNWADVVEAQTSTDADRPAGPNADHEDRPERL